MDYVVKFTDEFSPGLLFFGSFKITASISLGIICLFRFSGTFCFSFEWLYVSRNLSIVQVVQFLDIYMFIIFSYTSVCYIVFLLFHFSFYLFGSSLFSSLSWLKVSQSCLSFQQTSSWIHWSSESFFRLNFILLLTLCGGSFSSYFRCKVRLLIWFFLFLEIQL